MAKRKGSGKLRLVKIPLSMYADPEQAEALKKLSEATRVPQQAYLREGLDVVLKMYAKHIK